MSASLWYAASKTDIPPHTGDSWLGKGPFQEALKRQAKLNARAALAASFAAAFQALPFVPAVLWDDIPLHGHCPPVAVAASSRQSP